MHGSCTFHRWRLTLITTTSWNHQRNYKVCTIKVLIDSNNLNIEKGSGKNTIRTVQFGQARCLRHDEIKSWKLDNFIPATNLSSIFSLWVFVHKGEKCSLWEIYCTIGTSCSFIELWKCDMRKSVIQAKEGNLADQDYVIKRFRAGVVALVVVEQGFENEARWSRVWPLLISQFHITIITTKRTIQSQIFSPMVDILIFLM